MIKVLKNELQHSQRFRHLYYALKKIKHHYYLRIAIFNTLKVFRSFGIANKRYKNLKSLRNIHKNERCFIIATGPSLTMQDISKLENEFTFGMNSLCKIYDELGWESTYYGIQDTDVFEKLKSEIRRLKRSKVIVSDGIKASTGLNKDWIVFPLHLLNHAITFEDLTAKFSDDAYKTVYDGYTITYSLIQIAVFMGFKEIYLLGCDCHYSDDESKRHFVSSGVIDSTYKTAGLRMLYAYEEAKKFTESHGIKIYNATRGGMLEVFQRVDLDEVLGLKDQYE